MWINIVFGLTVVLYAGCGRKQGAGPQGSVAGNVSEQLVFIGDSREQIDLMLGDPKIEFPKGGMLVRWYAGYEVAISNDVVTSVKLRPLESEEEREEKALRAKLADQRLRKSYHALANKEQVSYEVWLERERKRLQQEREERAKVEAYKERVSREERTKVYAEALKACGCRYGHYCRKCR